MRSWLFFESELPIAASSARDSATDVDVVVIEPRLGARFEAQGSSKIVPFATVGLGLPVALSGDRRVIRNDVSLYPQVGTGVLLLRNRDWHMRFDARLLTTPERGAGLVTPEFEVSVSLYYAFGERGPRPSLPAWSEEPDTDGDGVPDRGDRCPERDEDHDGYEDRDGCPDIDNDFDLVLDIVDQCPGNPEIRNGFADEDGCPDTVPPEVRRIVGVVEGIGFGTRSAQLPRTGTRALRRLARVMARHQSFRIVVIGYTDDREASEGSRELSLRRARAVRDYLVERNIHPFRVKIAGRGTLDPVADNNSRHGRKKNRRVEIALHVYSPN